MFAFSHRLTLETDSDVIKGSERLSDSHLHASRTALFGHPDEFWSFTLRFVFSFLHPLETTPSD